MKQYITQIKRKKTEQNSDISTIIMGALPGYRIKSLGPRPLLQVNEVSLIDKIVDSLNKAIPDCDILLTIGYQADKIIKCVNKIRLIENQLFENTNEAEELRLAFNALSKHTNKVLIVDGDIWLEPNILEKINLNSSSIFIYNDVETDDKVSVSVEGGEAHIFTFGHKSKWSHIAYLTGKEFLLCKKILENKQKNKFKHLFEILNDIIEYGGSFKTIQTDKITKLDHTFYENYNSAR